MDTGDALGWFLRSPYAPKERLIRVCAHMCEMLRIRIAVFLDLCGSIAPRILGFGESAGI